MLLPELRALELAQCEATDDLLKLLFASTQKLNTLELIEVHGASAASLSTLSTLISLQHLSIHLHGCSPRHPSYLTTPTAPNISDSAPQDSFGNQPSSSSGTGVGGLLWGLLGYSRDSSQDGTGGRQQGVGEADQPPVPRLMPRDLWPIVRELPGLRHLQWVVWHQGKKAGQLQLLPSRVRRRARAAEPPACETYGAAAQHRALQQQQLQQYWSRQYQQQVLLQQLQQLQQQQPSLPPSASSPALSSVAAGAGTQSARSLPRSSRSLATLPPASSDLASGQLSSAGLVAAAAAAKAGAASAGTAGGQQGSGQPGSQPAPCNSSCWIAPPQAPPKELPSYCALGSWPSALYLAALLQHLPDLHLAYIDMREGGSKVAPATSTPPVQPALSKSTSSSSSLLGGAFMARSSSTPVIAHNRSSADHQRGAPGFGRDASKQSSSTQQGVDMIFTGGEVNGSVGRESERCNVREAEKVMVAGPLCHLPASGVPPWPVQDPWVGSTHYALDA